MKLFLPIVMTLLCCTQAKSSNQNPIVLDDHTSLTPNLSKMSVEEPTAKKHKTEETSPRRKHRPKYTVNRYAEVKNKKTAAIRKLMSTSGVINNESLNLASPLLQLPAPLVARICCLMDFNSLKAFRRTCKDINAITCSPLLEARFCLTIRDQDDNTVIFADGSKFTHMAFTNRSKHGTIEFSCHPAALKYVLNHPYRNFDGDGAISINRVLMFNKNLSTFILDVDFALLSKIYRELLLSLNLKPYIRSLSLPKCMTTQFASEQHFNAFLKAFTHINHFAFKDRTLKTK